MLPPLARPCARFRPPPSRKNPRYRADADAYLLARLRLLRWVVMKSPLFHRSAGSAGVIDVARSAIRGSVGIETARTLRRAGLAAADGTKKGRGAFRIG